jgi:ABC-2 type transport system ATP-binding protein
MLDLVRRTGTEFGIAVIVSSHLLGEIERVCDSIVAIEGGRLLRADTLSSFTGRTRVCSWRSTRGWSCSRRRSSGRACGSATRARPARRRARRRAARPIRDAVVDLDLSLVRLEQRRGSLEDLFRPHASEPAHAG